MAGDLNQRELVRYVRRISDRWPISQAMLGGARVQDLHGAGPQRERGEEFVVVLVSQAFDGVPWLERVHQAGNLWDRQEMGGRADVHCYTPVELERKKISLKTIRNACTSGVNLLSIDT